MHTFWNVKEEYVYALNTIIKHGWLGVSGFFVISGYGIAASINSSALHPVETRTFLWLSHRLKRIFSTYWWSLIFAALIIPLAISPFSMLRSIPVSHNFAHYSIWEWFQYATLTKVFTSTSWAINNPFQALNGAIWYIAIVVQIYIIVALCMLFSRKWWQLSWLLFILFLASLLTFIPSVKSVLPYGLFLPFFREFYIGILVYYLLNKGLAPKSKIVTLTILVFFLLILYYSASMSDEFLSLSFASTMGYIFLILHKHDYRMSNMIVVRPLYFVGIFSYSLYLLHIPLLPFCGIFIRNLIPLSPLLTFPVFLIPFIILLSFCWYLFFEKPHTQIDVILALRSPLKTIDSGWKFIKSSLLNNSNSRSGFSSLT